MFLFFLISPKKINERLFLRVNVESREKMVRYAAKNTQPKTRSRTDGENAGLRPPIEKYIFARMKNFNKYKKKI